jgi:hypothetical protein
VAFVKKQCEKFASQLITKLQGQFSTHNLMDEFSIMYPQYGYNQNLKQGLLLNLIVLIALKLSLDEFSVPTLFSTTIFDLQRSLFFNTMKKNFKLAMQKPFDVNPCTKLWKSFSSSQILVEKHS